ncbi:phosphate uptake regulator, PhoU [Thermosinus carboxydivorans Nor1]|uniref:Phosphate-specific transport system accessory protein PhoU n=3 Tax=Selenomonadales TaxID=909929 RepID=A1HRU2_9FIRM|nr:MULTISPECIES: phosphate signaling complex protein PhoU [Sporomusaceae]EAX47263.1 phosphate uptake regulator, PhoU [Thermosinus carboxydivorans Nor1]SDF16679.1 phosphate transport system protein [Sporolituus thermophilus DSM 23256]
MVTRQSYDQELEALRQELLRMGNAVAMAIEDAVQSLAKQDVNLARKVIEGDDIIDKMEVDIEDKCMVLIARQQPLARDLRIISTGLKITTDLERIGDHAYDIANVTLRLAHQPLIKPLVDIPRMAGMAQKMLHNALEAYFKLDITLAEQVCLADDEVDNLYQQIFRELLTYMMEDPRTISQATQLIFVGRYLERIADHATNIAEWVIYLVTGQRLRKK